MALTNQLSGADLTAIDSLMDTAAQNTADVAFSYVTQAIAWAGNNLDIIVILIFIGFIVGLARRFGARKLGMR